MERLWQCHHGYGCSDTGWGWGANLPVPFQGRWHVVQCPADLARGCEPMRCKGGSKKHNCKVSHLLSSTHLYLLGCDRFRSLPQWRIAGRTSSPCTWKQVSSHLENSSPGPRYLKEILWAHAENRADIGIKGSGPGTEAWLGMTSLAKLREMKIRMDIAGSEDKELGTN